MPAVFVPSLCFCLLPFSQAVSIQMLGGLVTATASTRTFDLLIMTGALMWGQVRCVCVFRIFFFFCCISGLKNFVERVKRCERWFGKCRTDLDLFKCDWMTLTLLTTWNTCLLTLNMAGGGTHFTNVASLLTKITHTTDWFQQIFWMKTESPWITHT